jgi:hypothetical protein
MVEMEAADIVSSIIFKEIPIHVITLNYNGLRSDVGKILLEINAVKFGSDNLRRGDTFSATRVLN